MNGPVGRSVRTPDGQKTMKPMGYDDLGRRIRVLRQTARMSLRELSRSAGMSTASVSAIENDKSSPTLATLHKVLRALGTDFAEFFASPAADSAKPVFEPVAMPVVKDAHRQYAILLPKRSDIKFEMLLETLAPNERRTDWETHDCDLGGVLLSGGPLRLDVEEQGEWVCRKGHAFYLKAGQRHRAVNIGKRPAKLVTVWYPPQY